MSTTTETRFEHPGETLGIEDHEHDLIHDLGRRLGCLWEYDRCIAHADGRPELREFWRDAKAQEQETIDRLKALIKRYSLGDDS